MRPLSRFRLFALLILGLVPGGCERAHAPAPEPGFADDGLPAATPLAASGHAELTSHADLMAFLEVLDRESPRVRLRSMGRSVAGRDLPFLEVSLDPDSAAFGARRDERLVLLVFAQQHGNEPSGKEGALELALELARGDHDALLAHVDLLLVPQVNPDGAEVHRRANDEGTDLNRSHLILDGPEVVALRELFHRWEPEVTVDVHEYYPWSGAWLDQGWLRLWDVQIGLPTNLNTHPAILALAEEGFLPRGVEALEARGFTGHNYVVGSPERLRWSTTHPNDGRQGFALLHTLSFIFEGKRSEPLATDMARRAEAQRVAMEALLRFTAEEGGRIRQAVHGARAEAAAGGLDRVVLAMGRERGEGPLEFPVLSATRAPDGGADSEWVVGDTVLAVVENWYPRVTEVRATSLPAGYLVPATEEALLALLAAHHVETRPLEGGETLAVEALSVSGTTTLLLESEQELLDGTAAPAETIQAATGDVLVPTAQLRGVLAAVLLEPGSMHGAATYPEFRHLRAPGPYPVLRVTSLP